MSCLPHREMINALITEKNELQRKLSERGTELQKELDHSKKRAQRLLDLIDENARLREKLESTRAELHDLQVKIAKDEARWQWIVRAQVTDVTCEPWWLTKSLGGIWALDGRRSLAFVFESKSAAKEALRQRDKDFGSRGKAVFVKVRKVAKDA